MPTALTGGNPLALEEHPGTWTYDPEAEAAYVYLHGPIPPGGVAETVTVDAMVNLDRDENGRVIGIEILAAWPAEPCGSSGQVSYEPSQGS
ncbi:hypothetical protein GCM10010156_53790 [Planobispora rosea]|uniref:DUF2283 domain-containing protein n=1 Tax=Planobispora rosea TaxID=35762 RepID=A0A8J3S6D0_PLARO|nr:DUF2283 domain-containing protein [Planobispora rosea]GGS88550.1 hypothetical protein GCM10010156_53790 [Planobispora rosea]GIH86811.1 hypothetical protein Pro02_52190 [Planobispora rosea]